VKRRSVLVAVVLLVLLAVGLLVYRGIASLDAIVARQIERHGAAVTGTSVRVGSVDLSLRSGEGTLRGLRVANPDGFGGGDAFALGAIIVRIDLGSLRRSPVVIDLVRISGADVDFVVDAEGRSNLEVIRDHARSVSGGRSGSERAGEGAERRFEIRELSFEGGHIDADTTAVGGKQTGLAMPPLSLDDVGGSRGATPEVIGKEVTTAFLGTVTSAVAKEGLADYLDRKLGKGTGDAARQLLKVLP
jgi:hypothetical protein